MLVEGTEFHYRLESSGISAKFSRLLPSIPESSDDFKWRTNEQITQVSGTMLQFVLLMKVVILNLHVKIIIHYQVSLIQMTI